MLLKKMGESVGIVVYANSQGDIIDKTNLFHELFAIMTKEKIQRNCSMCKDLVY